MVTNAFRLLVCLGSTSAGATAAARFRCHKRLSAFGMSWTWPAVRQCRPGAPGSQTPFGFWYVLDCNQYGHPSSRHVSQTPFGFWYVLDMKQRDYKDATDLGHKRLSAFGMSWTSMFFRHTLRQNNVCHKRLSAFGMSWTREVWVGNHRYPRRVTNAFRLLVCLGQAASKAAFDRHPNTVTNAFRLLVCLGLLDPRRCNRNWSLWSQTPFGFWYVLDGRAITRRIATGRLVTNAFRLLVCLGRRSHRSKRPKTPECHKRLSAFGMSWTASLTGKQS